MPRLTFHSPIHYARLGRIGSPYLGAHVVDDFGNLAPVDIFASVHSLHDGAALPTL